MQWLKSLLKPKAAVTTQAIPIPAAIDLDVPRYPPFMKGLPTIEPERLIAQHPEILSQYKRSVIVTPEQYERFYLGALRRFASYAHLLPASQSHHHRGAGGLLRHSMEVALWSLQGADNMLLSTGKTPAQRRAIEPRWQLTAFLAGLCHDVGKPATDMTVTSSDRNLSWKPLTENLYDWAKTHGLNSYFLEWRAGRGKQHISLSNLLAERIIGAEALQWIDEGGTELVVWLMEALSGNPGATNPLYDLVLRADSSSTERDLKTMGVAMAGYELGVPIERHLMDIMRRLIKEGIWQVNELGARVWNINGGIYLVWPASGDEIAAKVRSDDLKGFPRTADGILDMLLERGLAFVKEGGEERFWKIVPEVLEAKIPNKSLACIRLRDDAMISSTPIPAIAGRLLNAEDDEGEEESADTTAAAAAEPTTPAPAPVKSGGKTRTAETENTASKRNTKDAAPPPDALMSHPPEKDAANEPEQSASTESSDGAAQATQPEGPKAPPAKLKIDPDTGEILGIEAGDPNAKKQPKVREVVKVTSKEAAHGISKPVVIRLKSFNKEAAPEAQESPAQSAADSPVAQDIAEAKPDESSGGQTTPKKKKRNKLVFDQAPTIEFSGSVGELFLALADDLQQGAKLWNSDVRVDDEGMVLLRWPACFANYGLTAKTILDECGKKGWIWVDEDNPFVKLVDATFQGEDCKALRLMPEPGDALLYHAKYDHDRVSTMGAVSKVKEQEVQTPKADSVREQPKAPAPQAAMPTEGKPVEASVERPGLRQAKPLRPQTANFDEPEPKTKPHAQAEASQKPVVNDEGATVRPAAPVHDAKAQLREERDSINPGASEKQAQRKPQASASTKPPKVTPATAPAKPAAENKKTDVTDPMVASLLKVLNSCPAVAEDDEWRMVDRIAFRAAAIEAGVVKDRKQLNTTVEANAKTFHVNGSNLRYKKSLSV